MPRYMSPLRPRYMRSPADIPKEGLQVQSITPTPEAPKNAVSVNAAANANEESPEQQEPEYPETVCVSEGTFRQIRDDSLVLLSQGISHRLLRSIEGPFLIFVLPEHEDRSRVQLALYRKENPPKEENPPIPLSFSLQPLWVLIAPLTFTLIDFSDKVNFHSYGISDAG